MNKTNLQQALEMVKPGLANKEMIEQSTSFAFREGRVISYNDEISISHPVEGLEVVGAVKAEELYKLLAKLSQEEIEIEITGNEIILGWGKAKAGLTLQSEIVLPLEELGETGTWKALPEGFTDALKFVMPSASTDMSRPSLTCINVRKDGIIEASDGIRVTRMVINQLPVTDFLIPATTARDLIKYPVNRVASGDGWIHFRTEEGTIFSCRIFEGIFPDIDKAGIMNVEGEEIEFPKGLSEVIERAAIFARREHSVDEEITISIADKKITVEGQSDCGWLKETANIRYAGEPIGVVIHPTFLNEMLSKIRHCIIGKSSIKFSGENWDHVVWLKELA